MTRTIGALLLLCLLLIGLLPATVLAVSPARIVIDEIKIGGVASGQPTEYVVLFNGGDTAADLSGWVLEYAKATTPVVDCSAGAWTVASGTAPKVTKLAAATIAPGERVLIPVSLTDNVGGSVRLVQPLVTAVTHDLVGWASGTSTGPCQEAGVAITPGAGKRMQRKLGADTLPIDTDNNAEDFVLSDSSTPPGTRPTTAVDPKEPENTEGCAGITLSEVLANPAGADTGKEFIELYNGSSTPQPLAGCVLKTSANTKQYAVPSDQLLDMGEYRAFYAEQTGLQLGNQGGEVTLVTPSEEIVVQFPALADNQAVAFIDDSWQTTTQPTPNVPNVLTVPAVTEQEPAEATLTPCPAGKQRNPETNRCRAIELADSGELVPCSAGQARNPDTNRCRSLEALASDAGLAPCQAGQERNPQTNRCRSVAAATASASSLTPCQPGQERNPETNRCRKTAVLSASTQTPCSPGQERNPETNRCRKVVTPLSSADKAAVSTKQEPKQPLHFGALAGVASLMIGYGAYEYRGDIANAFSRLRKSKVVQ